MENWLKKNECTGCGVCSNICPRHAIEMVEDECGFRYPVFNNDKCVNCGLCKRGCPILRGKTNSNFIEPSVYACWSKNEDIRFNSTSGGLFSEIVIPILQGDGYVVGACYDENNEVRHVYIDNLDELYKLRQSKYTQSTMLNIYVETKKLLDTHKKVAFCGSPCQIAALNCFLGKKYDNLLTIEFICRGMNSPKAYRTWLQEIELNEGKKIEKVWFKYKEYGWNNSPKCTRIDFKDGTYKIYKDIDNKFMCGYLGPNLYIRPSCGNCQFNGLPRQADITLADFWGIDKKIDDDKGTSMVLINSNNGMKAFTQIKDNIVFYERKIEEIYLGNVCFSQSVLINKNSEKFLKEINCENFSYKVDQYSKVSLMSRIKKKLLRLMNK